MLKFLRKNTKTIVWAVVVAFVAWGGYAVSTQFQETSRSPGQIFGKEVSFPEYLLANRTAQIFSPVPEAEKEPPSANEIEARTWEFLVLSREAKRQKIAVSDEEVRQEVERLLGGKRGTGFAREQYFQWIRVTFREEPREFEKQVREHLRIRKLLAEVRQKARTDPEENLKRWLLELFRQAQIKVYQAKS